MNEEYVDISTDDPFELSDEEVTANLADILESGMKITSTRNNIVVKGSYDQWRYLMSLIK